MINQKEHKKPSPEPSGAHMFNKTGLELYPCARYHVQQLLTEHLEIIVYQLSTWFVVSQNIDLGNLLVLCVYFLIPRGIRKIIRNSFIGLWST